MRDFLTLAAWAGLAVGIATPDIPTLIFGAVCLAARIGLDNLHRLRR